MPNSQLLILSPPAGGGAARSRRTWTSTDTRRSSRGSSWRPRQTRVTDASMEHPGDRRWGNERARTTAARSVATRGWARTRFRRQRSHIAASRQTENTYTHTTHRRQPLVLWLFARSPLSCCSHPVPAGGRVGCAYEALPCSQRIPDPRVGCGACIVTQRERCDARGLSGGSGLHTDHFLVRLHTYTRPPAPIMVARRSWARGISWRQHVPCTSSTTRSCGRSTVFGIRQRHITMSA